MNRYLVTGLLGFLALTQINAETLTISAYCPCKVCCGKWAGGPTASGRMPRQGVSVAASRKIPLGSWITIQGIGKRRVDDRLAKRYDSRVDIFFQHHRDAKKFGIKKLDVTWPRS